jgi:release factor glutamine methyltransferase
MNAELLLMFTLNCDRAHLYAHPERGLTEDETSRYSAALEERARGVPAQYITGHQEFWGMDLIVTPVVLIPRPETEHVIETVVELQTSDISSQTSDVSLQTSAKTSPSGVRGPRSDAALNIADVGTGSGCIALALAKELPAAVIHATDISAAALEIARANAARHQLESRVHFHQVDLLAGFENNAFNFIVSNPPYVGESEADQVQLEVRKFEPPGAVFAGLTGTEVIARLIPQALARLKPGGWIVFEISGSIVESVKQLLQGWQNVFIKPDLQSLPRVVRAQKPKA